jgi:hypothetical protein
VFSLSTPCWPAARSAREAPGFVPPPPEAGALALALPEAVSTDGWAALPAALLLHVLATSLATAPVDAGAAAAAVYAALPRVCRAWRAATHARAAPGAWAALLGAVPLRWGALAGAPRAVLDAATRVRLPPPAAEDARLYTRVFIEYDDVASEEEVDGDADARPEYFTLPHQTDALLAIAALRACPRLEALRLGGDAPPALWRALALAAPPPALRALDVSNMEACACESASAAAFAAFAASPAAARLEDVALGGAPLACDVALAALAAGAGAALQRLRTRGASGGGALVTDAGAAALAASHAAGSLRSLELSDSAVGAHARALRPRKRKRRPLTHRCLLCPCRRRGRGLAARALRRAARALAARLRGRHGRNAARPRATRCRIGDDDDASRRQTSSSSFAAAAAVPGAGGAGRVAHARDARGRGGAARRAPRAARHRRFWGLIRKVIGRGGRCRE